MAEPFENCFYWYTIIQSNSRGKYVTGDMKDEPFVMLHYQLYTPQ